MMTTIPMYAATKSPMRDATAREIGVELARSDGAAGMPAKSDLEIIAALEAQTRADYEVTGWAEDAAIKAYRAAYVLDEEIADRQRLDSYLGKR